MDVADGPHLASRSDKTSRWLFWLLVLLSTVLAVSAVRQCLWCNVDHDEVEHAHVTWALGQGILPYRDLHQIHMPMLWIVCAPLLAMLPERAEAMLALRGVCVLACCGVFALSLLILREFAGKLKPLHVVMMLALSLVMACNLNFYSYRPDSLMTLFTAFAVLAAVRMGRSPLLYSTVGGLALGIAASFSTKMAPMCLLVPTMCVAEAVRRRDMRPLLWTIPHGLAFVAGIFPTAVWLWHHDLFDSYRYWTVSVNAHQFNIALDQTPWMIAVELGALLSIVKFMPGALKTPWSPAMTLLVAMALSCSILVLSPSHMAYNLQVFIVPASVLAAAMLVIAAEIETLPRWLRMAAMIALFTVVSVKQIGQGIHLKSPWTGCSLVNLQKLIDACPAADGTCVGFAPWHPIFRRDAIDLYQAWDYWFPTQPSLPTEGKQPYLAMWASAPSAIKASRPRLIVDQQFWGDAQKNHVLSEEQYNEFQQAVSDEYERVLLGDVSVYIRR